MIRRNLLACAIMLTSMAHAPASMAGMVPQPGATDPRIRTAAYDPGQVYVLHAAVGYQIDLQFEDGENFIGLAAGDIEGLSFVAQGSHLFLKPRAAAVDTNLTVITSLRQYHFEYSATLPGKPGADRDLMFAVRFIYQPRVQSLSAGDIDRKLQDGAVARSRNLDYWSCGAGSLRPVAAWDDGVQTHLSFGPRAEIPAIFRRNDDDSESLLNFSMQGGDVVIHGVARRLVLRRGALTACIVNKGYRGSGERLPGGTLAPDVLRAPKGERNDDAE